MKLIKIGKELKRCTNINKVEVPEELRIKHRTNLDWMDVALGGGFTATTGTMLTGDPGCGKSTMIRMAANALTAQGHVVLYNCGEESPVQVKMACERLNLNNGFFIGDDIFVSDILAHATLLQKKVPADRKLFVIVDSIQKCDDEAYDTGKTTKRTPVNCATQFMKWAHDTKNVFVQVHQVTKAGVFVGDNQMLHLMDVHLHLGFDRGKKSPTYGERVLTVNKNRYAFNGAVEPMVLEMNMGGALQPKYIAPVDEDADDADDDSMPSMTEEHDQLTEAAE